MLRHLILLAAGLFAAFALVAVVEQPTAWPILLPAALLLVGTLFERFHYRGAPAPRSGGTWHATSERFLDEESGLPVTVWFNAATGERRYVEPGEAPPV